MNLTRINQKLETTSKNRDKALKNKNLRLAKKWMLAHRRWTKAYFTWEAANGHNIALAAKWRRILKAEKRARKAIIDWSISGIYTIPGEM